jgi:hypothetical protein
MRKYKKTQIQLPPLKKITKMMFRMKKKENLRNRHSRFR